MKAIIRLTTLTLLASFGAVSCTMKSQEAPPLSGPSEFGTSVTISVSPDILPTDGGSQALVTITARDANGQPLRNLSLRTEILFNGVPTDFGQLSARNVVTDSAGRATLTYTAPIISSGVDSGLQVAISATPIGTDQANAIPRTASIRLVPTGAVVPVDGLQPDFEYAPEFVFTFQNISFDASNSRSNPLNPIVSYRWDFGDGTTASGINTTKQYSAPGDFAVRLTIFDAYGRSAFTTQTVRIAQSSGPSASFVISPSDPRVNDEVRFNGATSTAPPGRTIVRWDWDFGNGLSASGPTASTRYTTARNYTVVLTVTDSAGQTSTISNGVTIRP